MTTLTSAVPETSAPIPASGSTPRKVVLTPLTSLRFFAALHIFVFHIAAMPSAEDMKKIGEQMQASQRATTETEARVEAAIEGAAETDRAAEKTEVGQTSSEGPAGMGAEGGGEAALDRGAYGAMPKPLARLFMRGFCSTSLFFMLSGFVLAYLYIDGDGNQTVSNRDFWLARWVRVYPLHFLMLFFVLPAVLFMLSMFPTTTMWGIPVAKPLYGLLSGLLSVFLVQAWCPEAALSWNFATWALSAVVFFYAMFPLVVRWLKGQSRQALWGWFWTMPVLNLIPSIVFLALSDGNSMTNYFWSEVVMRTPLFWLPHFVMAIILARLFNITRHDMRWADVPQTSLPGWGDLAGVLLLVIFMTPDAFFQQLFGLGTKPPNFILRHGSLAPLYAVFIYNLALNRGWFARLLSHPWLEKLGEASFGIFILQGPMIFPAMLLFSGISSPLVRLLMTVAMVVGMALLSVRYFERPVARWLKKKWKIASAAG